MKLDEKENKQTNKQYTTKISKYNLRNGKRATCNVQLSSYGCTQEVARNERSVRVNRGVAESNYSLLRA